MTAVANPWPRLDGDGEDEDLVAAALAGDDHALDLILLRYRPFVRRRARRYFIPGGDRGDVVQEGMIGLYKAVTHYDPDRDRRFRTFAEVCVTNQILSAVTSAARFKNAPLTTAVRFAAPPSGGFDPIDEHLVATEDPEADVLSQEGADALRSFLAHTLTDLERAVLDRYVRGDGYEAIAAAVNRPAKAVDNALQRIRRKVEFFLRSSR